MLSGCTVPRVLLWPSVFCDQGVVTFQSRAAGIIRENLGLRVPFFDGFDRKPKGHHPFRVSPYFDESSAQ